MTAFLSHLSPSILYPTIFFGIIFLGGMMMLAAMYLAFSGMISLPVLFLITILAAIAIDTLWYVIGMRADKETIYEHRFVRPRAAMAKRFSRYFERHGALLVFITKFVYGARLASHILAGVHRIHYPKFLFAISLGTSVWFGIFYTLVYLFDASVGTAKTTTFHLQILFLGGAACIFVFNWIIGTFFKKKLMKN